MNKRNVMYDAPIDAGTDTSKFVKGQEVPNEIAALIAEAEANEHAASVLDREPVGTLKPDCIRSICNIQELADMCAHLHNRAAELAHSQILPKTPMEQHMLQMVMAQQNALLVGLSAFAQR